MSDDGSTIRRLMHRWDEEDANRDAKEAQAKREFLEQEANQLFAPLETYLTRLGKVLSQANATVEMDSTWEHIDERKIRRIARVTVGQTAECFFIDLTVEGVTIFYRNLPYRFTRAVETLIPVITKDVEQFITARTRPVVRLNGDPLAQSIAANVSR